MGMLCMSSYQPLRSGDEDIIHTKNPTAHLLPDMRLLEMQWGLKRLTALREAGPDDIHNGDDDDHCDDDHDLPSWNLQR